MATTAYSIFHELTGYLGTEGYFLVDTAQTQILHKELGPTPDERTLRQFISTYLTKQQIGIDIAAEFVVFYGAQKHLLLSRHNKVILGVVLQADADTYRD